MKEILASAVLIILHTLDGRELSVNPKQITHLTSRGQGALIVEGVNCAVGLADGKLLSVVETCEQIRAILEQLKR